MAHQQTAWTYGYRRARGEVIHALEKTKRPWQWWAYKHAIFIEEVERYGIVVTNRKTIAVYAGHLGILWTNMRPTQDEKRLVFDFSSSTQEPKE